MSLSSAVAFFDACRAGIMGPTLDAGEVSGVNIILEAMEGSPLSWTAYALATAWHETAHTMQPVKERGGDNYFFRKYDPKGQNPKLAKMLGNTESGDGVKFCGRGYVQLTGRANYAKAAAFTGQPLLDRPELAQQEDIAAKIMRWGMERGVFTGKRLGDMLPAGKPATRPEFVQARRIINGLDRAVDVAGYAVAFQDALIKGGWA